MAIARGNTSKAIGTAGESSKTWSHTVPATDNAILVVGVEQVGNTRTATATYNGEAMTELHSINLPSGGRKVHLFYIVIEEPDGNAHNIVVTLSGNHDTYSWLLVAGDYSDVAQEAPHKNNSTTEDYISTSPIDCSVTTTEDNCWLIAVVGGTTALTAGTDTSLRIGNDASSPSNANDLCLMDSNSAKTPAGAYGLQATWTGNQGEAMILMAVKPYASSSYSVDVETGGMVITGQNVSIDLTINVETGGLLITGGEVGIIRTGTSWENQNKNTASWSSPSKNSASWDNQNRNSATYTNLNKS